MKRTTTQEFIERARIVHGARYTYDGLVYSTAHVKVTITCPIHGDFDQAAYSHLRGNGCPACGLASNIAKNSVPRGLRKTNAEFAAEAKQVWQDKFTYKYSVYKGAKSPIEVKCRKHGMFWTTPNNHLNGSGCPKCRGYGFSDQEVKKQVEEALPKYKVLRVDGGRFVTLLCKQHGEFTQNRRNLVIFKQGCPTCSKQDATSALENKVLEWVRKHTQATQGDRTYLAGQEIDILCHKERLGIEINGRYWHSEKFKAPDYHYRKAVNAKRADLQLLQLWDYEIQNKGKICRSLILARLGKLDRWYARQLVVLPMTSTQAADWFNTNHLQGNANASVVYGLFNSGTCLAAMSFAKARFSDYEWEIVRFANSLNNTVVGGASRLWTHFVKEQKPVSVVSYADLRISQGNLYKQLGFTFKHRSAPNYVWWKAQTTLSRYQTQKHKLSKLLGYKFDADLSERANMQRAGWLQVFDAGNLVYVWNKG
jgi:predicted nucleic-acid-binding Zn-ribbon protein